MKIIHLHKLFLILILVAGIVRLWKISELGYFMMDEERDAFLVRRMLVDHRPLLIGGAIPGGINVGPLFFYISSIPYFLSNLNPIGPAYAAALVGVLSVTGVYFIGRKLFDGKVAILATVFSGFSLLNIIYHRPWWPLTTSQLVTLVVYLSLWSLTRCNLDIRQGYTFTSQRKWSLILVGALVVGAQSDPSTLSLIPLSVIWLWWKRKQIKLSKKLVVGMIGIFLFAHTTWFIFELRHDFLNTRAAAGLFNNVFKGPYLGLAKAWPYEPNQTFKMTAGVLYRLFIPTGTLDVTKQISPAEEFLRPRLDGIWWPGAYILLLIIGYYVIRSVVRELLKGPALLWQGRALIGLHFLISISGIFIYTVAFPGYIHEWMWAFMFPAFFLMLADMIVCLYELVKFTKLHALINFVNFTVLAAVVIWSIWQLTLFSRLTNSAGLGSKLKIAKEAQAQISGRPYELRSEGQDSLRYGGWRYLFTLYGNQPVKSYMDYVYEGWLYPKLEEKPETILTILNHESKSDFTLELFHPVQ